METPATDLPDEVDIGPLTWVRGEIDNALTRGLAALDGFAAEPGETTALKHAQTHIHQAAGAIQVVGLDAVVAFTDEIERQLQRLEDIDPAQVPAACEAIGRAARRLKVFLAELVNGAPLVALRLFPEYEAMQRVRGVQVPSPADLFFPDLSTRGAALAAVQALPLVTLAPVKMASHLVSQRRLFQRGLLSLLQGDESGLKTMREAVSGIEMVTTAPGIRAFWWTVGAVLDAIDAKGLAPSLALKQLIARIDVQIRRFVEGSSKVADRLRREVLYYAAISAPVTPSVREVQRVFNLSSLIPSAAAMSADLLRVEPLLRQAREQIDLAKDAWLKFTAGRAEHLLRLKQTMAAVRQHAAEIGNAPLTRLVTALAARLDEMPALNVPEAVAMEYATGLLFAENALANFATLGADFPQQVNLMVARLDAALHGKAPGPTTAAPLLDEMEKRAQERLLLASVCREIQANLRRMEQVLDGFFRDQGRRAELASLENDSRQVRGALRMLGLEQAETLLGLCATQIHTYATTPAPVANDDLELLAESLSCLGFYVEAVEQQRPAPERLIAPLLARRSGRQAVAVEEAAGSAEAAVRELRQAMPGLVAEVRGKPSDGTARKTLRTKLVALRDDATLIGDASLVSQANSALQELEAGATVQLAATLAAIGEAGAPAPTLSEETQRLLATDERELDGEFLHIYLTEAREVLDTIAENRAALEKNPGTRNALRGVRRSFHTLKGSGRMVGLNDLSEIAHSVEKIHNRLLEDEHPVTPAVLAMIAVAETSFRHWLDELRQHGAVRPDASQLEERIREVEAQVSGLAPPLELELPEGWPPVEEITPVAVPDWPPLGETVPEPSAAPPAEPIEEPIESRESIELPELGAVGTALPQVAAVDAPEDEGIDAQELVAQAPSAAAGARLDALTEPPVAETLEAPEDENVTVGGVTLPRVLFDILVNEAGEHLAALAAEIEAMQFDASLLPSEAMVRAGHTLCGIHRTSGFPLIAHTAKALEQCLAGLQESKQPRPIAVLPVLARAHSGLSRLVRQVRNREAFTDDDRAEALQVQYALEALRQETVAEGASADAEALAAREAAREPAAAAAPPPVVAAVSQPPVVEGDKRAAAHPPVPAPAVTPIVVPVVPVVPVARPQPAPPAPPTRPPPAPVPISAAAPRREKAVAAAPAVPAEAQVDPGLDLRDDVDEQVLPIFLEESAELFPQAGEALRAWRRQPLDQSAAQRLRRTLHTFKGSARMAGAMRLGELTHRMESRLLDAEALTEPAQSFFDSLDTDLDRIAWVLELLRLGKTNVPLPWLVSLEKAAPEVPATQARVPATGSPAQPAADAAPSVFAPQPAPVTAFPLGWASAEVEPGQRALLRVRADIIDRLVNEAGEMAITRARIDSELRALKANLLELTSSVIRLRAQVRDIEIQGETQISSRMALSGESGEGFDPLEFDRYTRFQELTRSLTESVNDVATVQQSLLKNIDDADVALLAQARLSREMQQQLFAIRTVPFGSLSERLYRIVRQTAKELDKRANLEIHGGQVELDRSVLEKLAGPLEHLLRNALDHGIEPREARLAAGKSEIGEIALTVRQVGNEIVIDIADDGAGLDLAQIRSKGAAQQRFAADAEPTPAQLIDCIFQPGFSTAEQVTALSGRGIGMDVVRAEVTTLGGRVEVSTQQGRGTTFQLYLPLTLAVAQAVLVRAAGRLWALPATMVEQVQQVKPEALRGLYEAGVVEWQGRRYPFHYLPRLLGDTQRNPDSSRHNPVLLLRAGQNVAAVHVDEMIGNQEVVVKNIGPQLARVSGIAGATVLGTGEIVLIINPVQLAQRAGVETFDPNAPDQIVAGMRGGPRVPLVMAPLVMIVDDSLTVRKVLSRVLAREGFGVLTARDGADALKLLDEHTPDVILLDIEMPRMDGFELTRTLKATPKHAHIPIIMITSRTAEKHRNRARELGVDLYLGKPFQEEELLRNLREMLALTP